MTMTDPFHTPWRLVFDRDGTEDVAIVCDAGGDELAQSGPFWLPQDGQPVPHTLAAMRLMCAAPTLLAALEGLLDHAENQALALEQLRDRPEAEAQAKRARQSVEAARAAIVAATGACPPLVSDEPDVHALLARRRQIAVIWSIEDVLEIRPDLSEEQAWEVLGEARHCHDATIGISWDVLACHVHLLFGDAHARREAHLTAGHTPPVGG